MFVSSLTFFLEQFRLLRTGTKAGEIILLPHKV